MLIFFVIVSFVIACFFYIISLIKNAENNQIDNYDFSQIKNSTQIKTIGGSGENYWFGSAEPKITIVEFGDFACPVCRDSYSKIREISVKYKDSIKFIYRDFPSLADYSGDLSLAARCAGEQGLFWPMHDKLFAHQGVNSQNEIYELARSLGADEARFQNCFQENKYLTDIQNDFSDGANLGVTGTPTWFINGQMVKGDIPYELFIKIIEDSIK
ncbi:MAG: thioredoxin domain-containing protein [bacterium]